MKYSNIDYTNDVKVLGRVVSITMDNKVAEAEQVFDTPFKYNDSSDHNIDEEKVGLSQYEINRLLQRKVWLLDNAGLIPEDQNAPIIIDNPVEFNNDVDAINIEVSDTLKTKDLNVTNLAEIKDAVISNNLNVLGDITADNVTVNHTLTANDIVSRQSINGATLEITGSSRFHGAVKMDNTLIVDGKTTLNGGIDVHGDAKFFDNVTIDGDTTVVNLTINGRFNAPHATTSSYGIVRLASALNSTADDDVVPVSLFRQYYQYLLDNDDTTAIDSIKELLDYVNQNGAEVPTKLDDLNDVTLTTPAAGDILYYDGTQWINTKLSTILNNLKQEILNEIQNQISSACLWKVQNDYLVPTVSGRNVATTGNGKFYSGI